MFVLFGGIRGGMERGKFAFANCNALFKRLRKKKKRKGILIKVTLILLLYMLKIC